MSFGRNGWHDYMRPDSTSALSHFGQIEYIYDMYERLACEPVR